MAVRDYVDTMKDKFVRENLMSDEFLDYIQGSMAPMDEMLAYYRCAIMEVETKFKVLNEQFSLRYDRNPIESIKSRVKSMEGIIRKIRRKSLPLSMESVQENIRDIAGVRVVTSFQDDIYKLAECLLQQDDVTLIQKKDYIQAPKPGGYRSLHLIVEIPIFLQDEKRLMKVEVQFRTIAMDFWASLEHKLRYKKNLPEEEAGQLATELLECAEMSATLDRRMLDIRDRITKLTT